MKYLFSNIFKGIRKKPLQVIGVILLVTISTLAYIGMNFSVESLERGYNKMIEATNQQHYSSSINVDFSAVTKEEAIEITSLLGFDINTETFPFTKDKVTTKYKYIELYSDSLADEIKSAGFYDLRKEINDNYLKNNRNNLNKIYTLFESKFLEKDGVVNEQAFSLSYQHDGKTFVFITITDKVNKPSLEKGAVATGSNQIMLFERYANANDIAIGSQYKIGNTSYEVSGFGLHPTFPYPLLNMESFFPDSSKETIVLLTQDAFFKFVTELGTGAIDYSMSIYSRFEDGVNNETRIDSIKESYKKFGNVTANKDNMRISAVLDEIEQGRIISFWFSVIVLVLGVIVIGFIVKKRLDNDSLTIGVLRALGYRNLEISTSYMAYPIISSIIGILLGYGAGLLVSRFFLLPQYSDVYAFNVHQIFFHGKTVLTGSLMPLLVINVLAFIVITMLLNKPVIDILKPGNKLDTKLVIPHIKSKKVFFTILRVVLYPLLFIGFLFRLLGAGIRKLALFCVRPFGFITRFKFSLAFRSMGRLMTLFMTILISGMFLSTALIGNGLMKDMTSLIFSGMNYQQIAIYRGVALDMSFDDLDENFRQQFKDTENGYCYQISIPAPVPINVDFMCYDNVSQALKMNREGTFVNFLIFDKKATLDTTVTQAMGTQIIKINDKEFEKEKRVNVMFNGLDPKTNEDRKDEEKMIKLIDEDGKDITSRLSEGFIISQFVASVNKINVGDTLYVEIAGRIIEDKVIAIHQEFNSAGIYYDKAKVNSEVLASIISMGNEPIQELQDRSFFDLLGLTEDLVLNKAYTMKYTKETNIDKNNTRYAFVIDFKNFEASINQGFKQMDTMINILVVVTGLISLIIVTIMTNFTIEDNFKNISVLKVMGYTNKEISKMVLRVYSPFVLLATILAVPVTAWLLGWGLGALASTIGILIPVRVNMFKATTTVIMILVVFVVSMMISKRTLKKVTLQEALKSE